MNWYISAICSAILFTGQFLSMQKLQETISIRVYMTYIWTGAGTVLFIIYLKNEYIPLLIKNLPILILGGLASWAGTYTYNLAIRYQANLGYVESLSSVRLAILFCVSILYLDSEFRIDKLNRTRSRVEGFHLSLLNPLPSQL